MERPSPINARVRPSSLLEDIFEGFLHSPAGNDVLDGLHQKRTWPQAGYVWLLFRFVQEHKVGKAHDLD